MSFNSKKKTPLPDDPMQAVEFDTNGGCWLWTAAATRGGRGCIAVDGKSIPAARYMFSRAYDLCIDGREVCHRCDVAACVNPDHLFLGTHADNMRDWAVKGLAIAAAHRRRRAPENVEKLTEDDARAVIEMARAGIPHKEIAAKFSISKAYVCNIFKGRRWPQLQGLTPDRRVAA
jgi:hypothetical protein